MARVLSFLIRYFSTYYTLHRSDLTARAAPLDPCLSINHGIYFFYIIIIIKLRCSCLFWTLVYSMLFGINILLLLILEFLPNSERIQNLTWTFFFFLFSQNNHPFFILLILLMDMIFWIRYEPQPKICIKPINKPVLTSLASSCYWIRERVCVR